MIDISTLQRIPRFAGLSSEATQWLASRFTRRHYPKKSPIFFEGEECKNLYVIEQGAVKVFKTLESGRELILNIFRLGESVGEVALIDNDVLPASAVAHEDTYLLELPRDDYFNMSKLFPEVFFATIRDLTHRVKVMTQRIHELGSGSVEARLSQLFITLSHTGQQTDEGVLLSFPISRQELADMIGVRIETVIRTMSRWHKEGIVITQSNGFLIPRPSQLEEILRRQNQ